MSSSANPSWSSETVLNSGASIISQITGSTKTENSKFFFLRRLHSYCQTKKNRERLKISGILIVYWPIAIKFRTREQTSKTQTKLSRALLVYFSQHNNISLIFLVFTVV